MKATTLSPRTIELGGDQLMVLDGGRGERVRVLCGTTWLTQEGDMGDALLGRGAELVLHDGRTLIQALEPTRLQILGGPVRGTLSLRALARRARHWVTRLQLGPVAPEPTT